MSRQEICPSPAHGANARGFTGSRFNQAVGGRLMASTRGAAGERAGLTLTRLSRRLHPSGISR